MDKLNRTGTAFAVFAVFLMLGAAYVYCNGNGSYSADARMNPDGSVTFEISGPNANYAYSVFSETDAPGTVYLYYDGSYPEFFNTRYAQKEYFGVMKAMLERRGATVSYADSDALKDVMNKDDCAIVFVTGALPDTVYDGTESCAFAEWMRERHGSVYWSGPEIGRYVLHKDRVDDRGRGYFDGNVNSDDMGARASKPSPMFQYTQTVYNNCAYGLRADQKDSKPLAFVSDDGYSSVSAARLFNGSVTVIGGNMAVKDVISQDVTDRTCIADLMICGLTCVSEGLEHGTGRLSGSVSSATVGKFPSYGNVAIRLTCGEPASHWGKCIKLDRSRHCASMQCAF